MAPQPNAVRSIDMQSFKYQIITVKQALVIYMNV
jgi:hypothetical protein